MTALDEACRQLAELARAEGLDGLTVAVWKDGRVTLQGGSTAHWGLATRWTVRADLAPGSADPLPSAALAERGGR